MTSCRVVTWNLWWRFGDWQRRFEVIAAELASVAPDVVGLQEVWARGSGADSVNAAGLLARRLGMHWAWVPSPAPERWQRKVGDSSLCEESGPGRAGNAVLTLIDAVRRCRSPGSRTPTCPGRRPARPTGGGCCTRRSTPRRGGCRSSRRS